MATGMTDHHLSGSSTLFRTTTPSQVLGKAMAAK